MKTAMQMMLDDLLAKRDVYENAKMYECVATLETSIEIAQFLHEKEKEQSINLIKQTCMFMGASIIDIEISKMEFEDIYNNYYNQKQHIIDIMKADENDGLYNQNK
jgi:hypothetical protein